jgi:8-oxo-dGTP pyrophosphatase MutT (NUDIX family)
MPDVRPAATVVLLRDAPDGLHVLLLRRNSTLGFAAGQWVFPGGRVDDAEIAEAPDALAAARLAAVRETLEEAQIRIESPDALLFYSHWTTPPVMPKRYATWFFVGRAPVEDAVTVDGGEIDDHLWVRPEEALLRQRREEIEMLPPTFVTLTELAACATVEEALMRAARRAVPVFEPHFVMRKGQPTVSIYAGDAGYADSDPDVPGRRHRMVMARGDWQYLNEGVIAW